MPEIGAIAEKLGYGFAFAMTMFYLMRQQEDRHRNEIRKEADEREALRDSYEKRSSASHDRMNDLTIEVLAVIRENSKAISTLVEAMRRSA